MWSCAAVKTAGACNCIDGHTLLLLAVLVLSVVIRSLLVSRVTEPSFRAVLQSYARHKQYDYRAVSWLPTMFPDTAHAMHLVVCLRCCDYSPTTFANRPLVAAPIARHSVLLQLQRVLCLLLQNSNLVLTAETRTREGAEPSGEPDSLWGRLKGKMGDRVMKGRPEGLDERKVKAKKK